MRVLVACEYSQRVTQAFRWAGVEAYSCDLLPTEGNASWHFQCDVRDLLSPGRWDLLIAHPDCTYLCSSGLHWNKRIAGREAKTQEALAFVRTLLAAPVPHICVENPVGRIGSAIRPADQYIQPYEFGHDASKRTGLWLKNLPPLLPTAFVRPHRVVGGKPRWGNQTDSGQNKLGPSPDRWKARARTYRGIAAAMAEQWIPYVKEQASAQV